MKFSQLTLGGRARLPVPLALGDSTVMVDVKVLSMAEEADVAAFAAAFAKSRGMGALDQDDPLYVYGRALRTIVLATVDHDSPSEAPEPFFASVDEVLASPLLTVQHVFLLSEHQSRWQEENSPTGQQLDFAEMMDRIAKIAEGDLDPFVSLAPSMRWQLVRIMARLLLDARAAKSAPGLSRPENGDASLPEPRQETPVKESPSAAGAP